jgi:hypothetical protein
MALGKATGSVHNREALFNPRRSLQMDISRKLGILVFFGVPVIIGGGIVYALFGGLLPMFIYQILLLLVAGGFISR